MTAGARIGRLDEVLAAIDAANAADPTLEAEGAALRPAAILYGERMTTELARLRPDASEHLRIAARGQHVERWKVPRTEHPEGRAGYLAWRGDRARAHAARVSAFMAAAGYGDQDRARVEGLLRKEGIKRNPEAQMLEDVICFVFLRWYFADFARKHAADDVHRIVSKTGRKMSAEARQRAVTELDLPPELASALTG